MFQAVFFGIMYGTDGPTGGTIIMIISSPTTITLTDFSLDMNQFRSAYKGIPNERYIIQV